MTTKNLYLHPRQWSVLPSLKQWGGHGFCFVVGMVDWTIFSQSTYFRNTWRLALAITNTYRPKHHILNLSSWKCCHWDCRCTSFQAAKLMKTFMSKMLVSDEYHSWAIDMNQVLGITFTVVMCSIWEGECRQVFPLKRNFTALLCSARYKRGIGVLHLQNMFGCLFYFCM